MCSKRFCLKRFGKLVKMLSYDVYYLVLSQKEQDENVQNYVRDIHVCVLITSIKIFMVCLGAWNGVDYCERFNPRNW